jgi:hypothetical protein
MLRNAVGGLIVATALSLTCSLQKREQCVFASNESATSTSTSTSADTATTTLNGSVQTVQITLEDLRDVGLDLKNVAKAASGLYDEVNIRPVQLIEEPDVIIGGTVIDIPVATTPVGPPAPAKKSRVDASMQVLTAAVTSLRATVVDFLGKDKSLTLTPAVQTDLAAKIDEWVTHVNELDAKYGILQKLTVSPPYNQDEIAALTSVMITETKGLDKTRREIYKEIHKDGEHHKWF